MDLNPYVDDLRRQLDVAASSGGAEARELTGRLLAPLESATRLVLLEALSAAAAEITSELAPGSVDVRLRGRDPEFVVTQAPTEQSFRESPTMGTAASTSPEPDEGATSRLTLRLSEQLKLRIEHAASRDGLSVNSWLARAAASAVDPDQQSRSTKRGGQRFSGWVQ